MKKETIEQAAGKYAGKYALSTRHISHIGFEDGAKWQAERMYSKQDLIDFVYFINDRHFNKYTVDTDEVDLFIEKFKNK